MRLVERTGSRTTAAGRRRIPHPRALGWPVPERLVLLSELINDEMRLLMWQVQLVYMLDSIYVCTARGIRRKHVAMWVLRCPKTGEVGLGATRHNMQQHSDQMCRLRLMSKCRFRAGTSAEEMCESRLLPSASKNEGVHLETSLFHPSEPVPSSRFLTYWMVEKFLFLRG